LLKESNEVNITVTGRKTKKRFSTPVWFVLDGERVAIVPMKGSDNNWFKNLAQSPQIELSVSGVSALCKASIVRDPKQVEEVIDKLRAKYRSTWSEAYYTKRDVYVEVPV
jgi:deazaflavin-dependent oxidoreductase (nitroreductase family)